MAFGLGKKTGDTGADDVVDTPKNLEVAAPDRLPAPEEMVGVDQEPITPAAEEETDAGADGKATVDDALVEKEKDEIDDLLGDIFEADDSENDDLRTLASKLPEVEIGELVAMAREIAEKMGLPTAT